MGGWFRKEIKCVADMSGVKMRIGGFGGSIISRIGVVPQQIPGGEIYPALEKGTVDAAEWVGPYDDQKLGFNKVAPFYYYPGWWEGGSMLHVFVGKDKWDALPRSYQAIVEAAGAYANDEMMAKYDILNPKALRELVAGGAQLRPFPQDVMEACFKASVDVYAELNAENAKFQEGLRHLGAGQRRRESLVAGVGGDVRQFHDGPAARQGALSTGRGARSRAIATSGE